MKKKQKCPGIGLAMALLAAALIAVIAVVLWKQWEYGASKEFYDGLRGALRCGGWGA